MSNKTFCFELSSSVVVDDMLMGIEVGCFNRDLNIVKSNLNDMFLIQLGNLLDDFVHYRYHWFVSIQTISNHLIWTNFYEISTCNWLAYFPNWV